jgi:ParB family chromosome partitioning protein
MGELDMHQLIRTYRGLRIAAPAAEARLLASLAAVGQTSPVLVVPPEPAAPGRYVLIDGYRRVAALERLGRDTVAAVVVPMAEREALLWHHQQSGARARTALEEAWLLRELLERHGLSQAELARQLGHTESWVSRRLGLLTALPESVQQMVRQGRIGAHAAEKYLVPLARAKGEDCERVARAVAGAAVSTRARKRLYVAWKRGTAEQKPRLTDNPLMFLAAEAELHARCSEPPCRRTPPPLSPPLSLDDELALALDELARASRHICQQIEARAREIALPEPVRRAWTRAQSYLATLHHALEERCNAG